jgi:hypothetical protein
MSCLKRGLVFCWYISLRQFSWNGAVAESKTYLQSAYRWTKQHRGILCSAINHRPLPRQWEIKEFGMSTVQECSTLRCYCFLGYRAELFGGGSLCSSWSILHPSSAEISVCFYSVLRIKFQYWRWMLYASPKRLHFLLHDVIPPRTYPFVVTAKRNSSPISSAGLVTIRRECAMTYLVGALSYKVDVRGFDSRWTHYNFSI